MATRIAAGDNISAFGDDAHAVPIVPENVLKVGETSSVFGIEITLNNAGFLKPADKSYVDEMEYWFVEFTGKSTSNEIQYGINPGVESQLQYLQNGSYIWDLDEFKQRVCDYENMTEGLDPNESFHCHFIYLVPADERNIYWVYSRIDNGVDGSYEERSVVFQIR